VNFFKLAFFSILRMLSAILTDGPGSINSHMNADSETFFHHISSLAATILIGHFELSNWLWLQVPEFPGDQAESRVCARPLGWPAAGAHLPQVGILLILSSSGCLSYSRG
jgi:hypothetical protein